MYHGAFLKKSTDSADKSCDCWLVRQSVHYHLEGRVKVVSQPLEWLTVLTQLPLCRVIAALLLVVIGCHNNPGLATRHFTVMSLGSIRFLDNEQRNPV